MDVNKNPFYKFHLKDHRSHVSALAARGRTLVSGNSDRSVRVWDTITGKCKWILTGHTGKGLFFLVPLNPIAVLTPHPHSVNSVALDPKRNIACSGSDDKTVRVWDLNTGTERFMLTEHPSSVTLLGLSASHLVSADKSTVRVWDPDTGERKHTLTACNLFINCFQHDEFKVLCGSFDSLSMWDLSNQRTPEKCLTRDMQVRRVAFDGRWCLAHGHRQHRGVVDVWDFGTEVIKNWDGTEELRDVSDRIAEPSNGSSDDTTDDEYEEEDAVVTDVGSLEIAPSSRDSNARMD